ncbi:hypothetical protein [Streptomyces collinus]|uniref:hypothetical protein n=1 Tax=Streptomyces collinus TaxID=42684 RepID=UPI0033F04631
MPYNARSQDLHDPRALAAPGQGHPGGVAGREEAPVVTVALLLLPVLSVLLYGLDQVEDRWVTRTAPSARHARRRSPLRRPWTRPHRR